jgi:hypothetical protein
MDELQAFEGVGVTKAAHQLLDDVNRDRQRKRDALLRAAVPHRAQILALDEIHAEVDLALDLTRVEDADQVSVRQTNHDLGLVLEPLQVALFDQVRQARS